VGEDAVGELADARDEVGRVLGREGLGDRLVRGFQEAIRDFGALGAGA
jgi:hypothetical protein